METAKRNVGVARGRDLLVKGKSVFLRAPTPDDREPFLEMVERSRKLHRPWVDPPSDEVEFAQYLERAGTPDHQAIFACHRKTLALFGVFNLSQIVRGPFQSAYLGYYADARHVGQGLMSEALHLVLGHAFRTLRLHRIEANIQPGNERSIRLVTRCGFHCEGFSPRYLKILGRWRDHERWAILSEDWQAQGGRTPRRGSGGVP